MPVPVRPAALLLDLGGTILTEKRSDAMAGFDHLLTIARSDRRIERDTIRHEVKALLDAVNLRRVASGIEFPIRSTLRLARERFRLEFAIAEGEIEWEFWREAMWCVPEPGVVDAIAEAAHRDLPIAVVSNAAFTADTLERELKIHGMQNCFRFVMTSADYGFRKPEPAVFLAAAGRLGLPPGSIWVIGDSLEMDVAGARGAGMTGVWYNPEGRAELGADLGPAPHHVLQRWSDLPALLDSAR